LNDIPGKTEEEKKADELEKIKEGYRQVEQDFEEEAEEQHRRKEKEARERKESEEQDPQQKEKKRVAIEQSLEKLQTETRKYDDGLVAGYKEDIDTLLVFVGSSFVEAIQLSNSHLGRSFLCRRHCLPH
jgi:hypothetical protein